MNKRLVFSIIGGVLGLALVVAIAVSTVSGGGGTEEEAYGEVTVQGDDLPVFGGEPANDPAVGMTAPTVSGTGFEGNEVSIEPDGRPKVVVFLAHWCPHCQNEVPEIVDWLEAGNKPEGVDFYSVSTLLQRLRGNWPPQEWLEGENWDVPVIQDDASNSASTAFGMQGTPFWVVLDGDNQVMARIPGEIGQEGLEAVFSTAAQNA